MNNDDKPVLIFQQTGVVRSVLNPDFFNLITKGSLDE
jgi:hypothetical protein